MPTPNCCDAPKLSTISEKTTETEHTAYVHCKNCDAFYQIKEEVNGPQLS